MTPPERELSLLRIAGLTLVAFIAATAAMLITLVAIGWVMADGAEVSLFFLVLYLGARYGLAPILFAVYFLMMLWGLARYRSRR